MSPAFNPAAAKYALADYDHISPKEIRARGKGNGHDALRFKLIAFDDIRIDRAPAYLVKGNCPAHGSLCVLGATEMRKSFLVFDMMMHVALGWEYRGWKVRQVAVVYCALDGGAAFKNRVEAFRQVRLAEDARGVPFHLVASPLIEAIRATVGMAPPAAVVIDTLNPSLAASKAMTGTWQLMSKPPMQSGVP
jgi:hypothetical protein